jgi:hypothetical protein
MSKDSSENEIYVIDSETVAHSVKNSHRIWLKLPGLKGKKHNDNSMRQLTRDHKNIFAKLKNYKEYLSKEEIKFIEEHSSGWMNKYKDAWNLIGK